MLFNKANPPYLGSDNSVQSMMLKVVYALVPGTIAAFWFFGWGVLFNLIIAALACLGGELLMLRFRRRPVEPAITDGSDPFSSGLAARTTRS